MKNVLLLLHNSTSFINLQREKAMKITLFTLILCFMSLVGFSNVTVVGASGGTNICSTVATSPTTLGTITISEGATTDFNAGASSITLAPPPGWTFVVSLPSVIAAPGNDVTIGVISITPTSFTINFNASGTTHTDVISISSLQIQATTSGSLPGYIYASSDFGVAGITTGAAGTNFGSLSISAAAVPTVTIAASPSATACAGSPITFTPTPTNGGASPTYQWFVNGSFVGGGSFYSTSTLSNGNTVYGQMTPSGGACVVPGAVSSNTVTVTINAAPTTVTVSGGGTFCGNAVLTAANGGSGTIYFQGTTSGGTSTVLGGTPQTVTSSGTYYFNAQSGAGCWGTQGSTAVVINPAATANAGIAQSVCAGGTITLAGSIGGGATTSTWSAPSGTFSNVNSLTSTYTPSIASGTVTLTLTTNDPDGAGPCTAATSTVNITVNAVPNAVSVSGGGSFCGSDVVSATLVGPGNIFFQGTTSGGTSTVLGGTPQTVLASGTYYFRAQGLAGGCWGPDGNAVVTITPAPTANAGLPQTVCAGGTVTLSGSIGGTATTSTWSAPSGVFSNPSSLTSTYTPSIASGNVTLTLTTNASLPCPAATSTVIITVNAIPNAVSVVGAGTFCNTTNITASLVGPGTIFFQGTTSGGTSTVLGGTPQTITSSGTYYFNAQSASGCWGTQGSAAVTINPLPSAYNVTGGGGYCTGGAGVDVGLSFSDAGVNYQLWRGVTSLATIAGTNAPIDFGVQTVAGTYTIVATNPVTGCTRNQTGNAVVAINPLPTAFAVTGGGSFCAGSTGVAVGLSGSAVGVSYQLLNIGIPTGAPVPGTGGVITFGLQTSAGTYTVLATITATGCTNTMTGSVSVTINSLPIAYSVTGGGIYCAGGTGVVVGLGNSQTLTNYQLFRGATLISTLAGTGGVLNFGLQTVAGTYTVVATSTVNGCVNNMTGSAVVSISPLPGLFTVTGGGSYCAGGTGVDVGLSGSAVGIEYQLFVGATPVGLAMAGTGSALDFGMQATVGTYTVVATNATSLCTNNMTGSAIISTTALPTAFTITGGGSYCAGGTGMVVGLSNSQPGVDYQLYNLFAPVGAPLPGTGAALNFGLHTVAGFYTVIATNTTTLCTNNMTGGVAITILPLPTVYNVTGGGGYCAGGTGVHVGLSFSDGGVNYQLYNGAVPVGGPVAGTGSALDFGLETAAGIYTVVATDASTTCTNNMTGFVVVFINPAPTAFAMTGGGVYCEFGAGVHVGLAGSTPGINYQLFNGASALGAPVAGTGAAIDFGLETASGTYTVVATDATVGCVSNMTGSVTVTMNPAPLAYAVIGGGAYCAGGTGVHVGLSNSTVGINYQLYQGVTAMGAPMPGTGAAIDFGLKTVAGTYTVIATNAITLCTNTMTGSVAVTINPLPTAYIVTGGGAYCAGGTGMDVALSNSDLGVNYQLRIGGVAIGSPLAGTGSLLDFGLQTGAGIYTVVATDAVTGCTNNMSSSATVSINPLPTLYSITGGGTYCTGGAGYDLGLSGSNVGISYQLFNGASPAGAAILGTGTPLDFGFQTTAGTYTVVATNTVTGCTNTMTGTAVIAISAYPVVAAIAGPGTVCQGANITLTDITTGGFWASSAITIGTVGSSTGVVTGVASGAVTISYTVTNLAGCATTVTVNELVLPAPTVTPILGSGGGSVCQGLTISLSDSTTGGVWSSSNPAVGSVSTSGVVTGVSTGGIMISYTITGGSGCTATVMTPISVGNPMPTASLSPSGTVSLCKGNPVTLSVVTSGGTGLTYQWYESGIPIAGAITSTYVATTPGLYSASIDNGTCTEVFAATNVVIESAPVIFLDTAAGLLFTTTPFVTYQWYLNGFAIPGATSNNTPAGPLGSMYTVIVSDGNGCTDTSAVFVYGVVNKVPTYMAAGDVRIYPNPATSVLHIDAPARVLVSVLGTDGKVLIERKEAISINVSQLTDGMYIIMVYDENNTLVKTEKFVKMQ